MGIRFGTRVGRRSWVTMPLWVLVLGAPFIAAWYVILFTAGVLYWVTVKLVRLARLAVGGILTFIILGSREAMKVGRAKPERSPSGDDSGSTTSNLLDDGEPQSTDADEVAPAGIPQQRPVVEDEVEQARSLGSDSAG